MLLLYCAIMLSPYISENLAFQETLARRFVAAAGHTLDRANPHDDSKKEHTRTIGHVLVVMLLLLLLLHRPIPTHREHSGQQQPAST